MGQVIFKPEGALTFGTIAGFQALIKKSIRSLKNETLVFDLSMTEKCDSAGLALLIDSVAQLKKQSLSYEFVGLSRDLRSLAKFYEVEQLLANSP